VGFNERNKLIYKEESMYYKELGLVNTRDIFKKAMAGKYAIGAYNFNNMEQLQAIVMASSESNAPVILQVSKGARQYANETLLKYMAMGAVKMVREMGSEIPIVLHLDHGDTFETCKQCVDDGFTSVMIDGSHHSFEDNIAITKKVVDYAHAHGVVVEAELGQLGGIEEDVVGLSHEDVMNHLTDPDQAVEFVEKTGVDSLAIACGAMLVFCQNFCYTKTSVPERMLFLLTALLATCYGQYGHTGVLVATIILFTVLMIFQRKKRSAQGNI